MLAKTRNLESIFDPVITYHIPLFQRPYVWTEEENWQPLWEDIISLVNKQLEQGDAHHHFLGAIVLEQIKNTTGSVELRQVIDGQQRLTTLQLFLIAARDYCHLSGGGKYEERFSDFCTNKESRVETELDVFKVWPTNADREDFKKVYSATSVAGVLELYSTTGKQVGRNIPDAYLYFSERISDFVTEKTQGNEDENDKNIYQLEEVLEGLWKVVKNHLQIVVIDLEEGDESQVIFETLNARGTQLLPADLVKNYLFHRAEAAKEPIQKLYDEHWTKFDDAFWRKEVKQGRIKRPRIDLFLQHYLSLKTLDDVRVTHLFNVFKNFSENKLLPSGKKDVEASKPGNQLESLSKYGDVFKTFYESSENPRLHIFLRRLAAIDTATVYPFLLEACFTLQKESKDELNKILTLLESFLIRRMICGFTSKNYNKLFIDLLKYSVTDGKVDEKLVADFLKKGEGPSNRFPNDDELKSAFLNHPIYQWLAQYKVRAILEALDKELDHAKSEKVELPEGLQIEHVLPQKWKDHWPLSLDNADDDLEVQKLTEERNKHVHLIGNLTLITGSLNPALSNSGWMIKQPELIKFSKLNLNRYFHDKNDQWNEGEIDERSEKLYELAKKVWPYPS